MKASEIQGNGGRREVASGTDIVVMIDDLVEEFDLWNNETDRRIYYEVTGQ